MDKSKLAVATLALCGIGWQGPGFRVNRLLKEETMTIEYNAATDEATIIIATESEFALGQVEVTGPDRTPVLRMLAPSAPLALQGFVIEMHEKSASTLFANYPEGPYDIRAITVEGDAAMGSATLIHDLLPVPTVLTPVPGQVGVATNLIVRWVPDSQAVGYRVVLEQGENDGLTVELPRGSSSFQVPRGVLAGDTASHVEVGAISQNGNCTVLEVAFTTE